MPTTTTAATTAKAHQQLLTPKGTGDAFILPPLPSALRSRLEVGGDAVDHGGSVIALPSRDAPSGWVWPPVEGRSRLQEISSDGDAREIAPGAWLVEGEQWRLYTAADDDFATVDDARDALVRWAQQHVRLEGWLTPDRCLVLTPVDDGRVRLWQVVKREASLWSRLHRALQGTNDSPSTHERRLRSTVVAVADQCQRVDARWEHAPYDLPCTLETVCADDARCIAFLPPADRLLPPGRVLRSERLLRQLRRLLRRELGADADRYLSLTGADA